MNKNFIIILVCFLASACRVNHHFTNTTLVPSTPLKHQKYTGQCWSFASTSLLEAEALRLGYTVPELSSFFYVYHNYLDQAENYMKSNGKAYSESGNLTFSELEGLKNYGAVPESVYNGKLAQVKTERQRLNRMSEENRMNKQIKNGLDSLIAIKKDIPGAMQWIRGILNSYIGPIPDTFVYNSEVYTPKTFAEKYLPLRVQDYVELTSYTHHPFYRHIVLEIPANWRQKSYWNVPLNRFISIIDSAIYKGYTLAWDGDIGNSGGFADNGYVRVKGEYETEKEIKQEQRQSAYDRKTTTDDHNMHLVGITYAPSGEKFYILKNTWGANRGIKGFWYLSENYFRLRTISVTIHKDAVPGNTPE